MLLPGILKQLTLEKSGLLGLIPIFLGLKVLLLGDSDGEAIAKDGLRKDDKNLKSLY